MLINMEFEVLTLRHPANNPDINSSKSRTESQALHSNRHQLYLYYLSISSGSIKTCIEWARCNGLEKATWSTHGHLFTMINAEPLPVAQLLYVCWGREGTKLERWDACFFGEWKKSKRKQTKRALVNIYYSSQSKSFISLGGCSKYKTFERFLSWKCCMQ